MEYRGKRNIYGYNFIGMTEQYFELNEKTSPIVRQIFHMLLEGKSLEKIVNFLNNNSYRTPSEYIKSNKIKRILTEKKEGVDYLWDIKMVRRILKNKIYVGELEWNSREGL